MRIAEIFYSLQGEGSLIGVPSVFVRTSGCNLRCVWCDTPYTSWHPEGPEMSEDAIVAAVAAYPAKHVVLTGGEPMLFPASVSLTERFREAGLHITIETAGTVYQPVACDLMSISPKLANSIPEGEWRDRHDRTRIQRDVLLRLIDEYPYQLKFVVMTPQDMDEIRALVDGLHASNVVLMPEGRDNNVLNERAQWLAEICKREGYRFSPRLHVTLWGDQRGT